MRLLIATLLMLLGLTSTTQAGTIVIGDSISSRPDAWPKIIESRGEPVRVLAQSGRTAANYQIPHDLRSDVGYDKAIYFLGTNDAFFSVDAFKEQFNIHLFTLAFKGFEVYVIVPPNYSFMPRIQQVRNHILNACAFFNQTCIDLDPIWDYELTDDTDHPLPALQTIIADYLWNEIYSGGATAN